MIIDSIFERFPLIETGRLVLRDFRLRDVQTFFEIRSNEEVMKFMDREPFQSEDEAEKMIESVLESYEKKTGINWAITLEGSQGMIGYVGLWKWTKEHFRAELGYALFPGYWGRGIMHEALTAVIDFGFEAMGLHRIEADVNPENIPSIKRLEKLGFQREAYFRENIFFGGKFCDSAIYALLKPT
ncbi:MAG: GNAT family N-acetyltransferase [bacterium]|nr:GNAT family N-acetyltransferase [bacterium]